MKKVLIILLIALTLLFALFPSLLGFSLLRIGDAVSVSTAMGAKLGCSARFITGQGETQIIEDLASYSPANRLLDIHYQDSRATASLLGMATTSATYRPGLGCTLDDGDTSELDRLVVADMPPKTAPWPAGFQVSTILPEVQEKLDQMLAEDNLAGLDSRALLVVKQGQIVAESYAEGISPQTPLLGWSMGKSLTAILQGRMQQLGLVHVSDQGLFEPWQQDKRQQISLKHMLTMTSGLMFDETYAPGSDSTRMLFQSHSASEVAMDTELVHVPGAHFSYSSGTTNLIARYLHDRLGGDQAALDFFQTQLLAPLGMTHSLFEPDPSGVFVGSSYVYASARDWARLGLLMLYEGQWQGEQFLSQEWVAQARSPNSSRNDSRYGYQFWLNRGNEGEALRWPALPADAYAMQGNRKQVVMVIPSEQLVLVRLGWTKEQYPMEGNFSALVTLLAGMESR